MSAAAPALSVLDLVPVRTDQTTADALAASLSLARVADHLGYRRYWVAEHHNMPAVAATNPPVLMGLIASVTSRIRVGSGGVMLPNHAPLVVAEQVALLEAAFPGRVDLGIGRAPGTDPITSYALRHGGGGVSDDAVSHFPQYVDDVLAMMSPAGVSVSVAGRTQPLRATPGAAGRAQAWLLGSSDYSARLAAAKGLPYVFAHHFSGQGTAAGALSRLAASYDVDEVMLHPVAGAYAGTDPRCAPTREATVRLAADWVFAASSD
jgi:luciferase family oxidoreductase group 1